MKIENTKKPNLLKEFNKAVNEFMEAFAEIITPKLKEATEKLRKLKDKECNKDLDVKDLKLIKDD